MTPPGQPVVPGQPFLVTATVVLPPGYYQDTGSSFLVFEPQGNLKVVGRWTSAAVLRDGKPSFTGTFVLRRSVVLPPETPDGPLVLTWKTGWQICQIDGVCLLPAERQVRLPLTVGAKGGVSRPGLDFWGALLLAFLGGILLNLMPCVFPVLALKGLSLASASGRTLAERRREALLFATGGFGVLVGLGLLTAALLAGGQRLDWGFSFQQPAFVWLLTLVFWFFTLQLWGLWSWPASLFSLSTGVRPSAAGALAGGAFSVVAAVPCTAPLLGPALGFALGQPPLFVPLFFAAAGLGLVGPLLTLQWIPGWARWLPRPGPWMVRTERVFGFFLAATVLYLLWIFTEQTGADRWLPALAFLGALAAATAWRRRKRASGLEIQAARALLTVLAAGSFLLIWMPEATDSPPRLGQPLEAGWRPFSALAVQTAVAEGHPVLVDATAAWCATCQINELAVLGRADVRAQLDRLGVVRLRADYTVPDPSIRSWLASVHRAGLPVYALYRPGLEPYLFPELLTDDNFTRALPRLLDGTLPFR